MPMVRWVGRCGSVTWVGEVENQQDFGVQVLLSSFFSDFVSVFLGTLEKKLGPKEKGHSSVTKKK